MAEALLAAFESQGREEIVGGNTPFLLDDPGSVWLVARGRVEVFVVAREEGRPVGTRRHYFTADEGDLLFGMDLDAYGEEMGLLAVGVVGTRLLRLATGSAPELANRLQALAREPGIAPELAGALDRWIGGLSAGVTKGIVPRPRADLVTQPSKTGKPKLLPPGKRMRPLHGTGWARQVEGSSLFIGMEEPGTDAESPFPISSEAWLQALEVSEIFVEETPEVLERGQAWQGLEALYGAIFRCEFFNSRLATVDEHNRLRDRAARDRRAREASLNRIVEVMEARPSLLAGLETDDALLAAATAVGRHMHIDVKAPPSSASEDEAPQNPLQEISRASRIRMRQVVLKGEWWKEDCGPFLAFMEEDSRPVAILPSSMTSHEVYDPGDSSRREVTPQIAEEIQGRAWVFYRPFPEKKLDPLTMLQFAAESLSRTELWRPVLVGIGGGLLGMVTPYFLGELVDTVIPEASRTQLIQLAIILAVVALTTTAFDLVRGLSILRIEAKMSATVQPAMWDRLLSLPTAFFRRFSSGDLAQRAGGIDMIRRVLSGATMSAVMTCLFSIFNYGLLFYYSWQLALVATVLILIAVGATMLTAWARIRLQKEIMEVEGRLSGLVLQLLAGMAKLRVTGAESRAFAEWAREFSAQKKLGLRTGRIENRLEVWNSGFPILSAITVFFFLMWIVGEAAAAGVPPLSAGDFIGFNSAFGIVLSQSLEMSMAAMSVLQIFPIFDRAKPILEEPPEVDTSKLDPGELAGRIEVNHVTFRYHEDQAPILDDVSLTIEPGEFVALVGPSGSGKSTMLRILLGLENPETGSVYYDGRDITLLDVQKLRRRIGVVSQNGVVRAGSIFANIVGSSPLTQDDAWRAAKMAGFEDDVKQMPMGMNTIIQQGGMTLSGGQRQRLMIARAIVNRPRVLFFDEATSALDNRTQSIVSQSLEELQATRVAIAHRLTTIQGADRIYVMKGGRIIQQGSYQQLAEQEGLFQELIKRQVA